MAVTGIGGLFFRATDPKALGEWYKTHLGVGGEGWEPWQQAAGPTLFLPFKADTDMWPANKGHMLNLRVDDLDGLLEQLRGAGNEVNTDPAWNSPETGQFARLTDPEGNLVELWQPPTE